MKIKLSDHFTYSRLIRFTLPSIGMMIFTSIYGVVDGFFVSNFAGSRAFASVNLIMPFVMIMSAVGFMVGTGGSALVSMTLGQKNEKKANEIFSLLIYLLIAFGIVVSILGAIFAPQVARLLGATDDMMKYCVTYARISMISMTAYMLQTVFQTFMITAERPHFGFYVTIAAGVTNMVLDAIFVGVFRWGVAGAASATVCSELVGGLVPLFYFMSPKNTSLLHLGRTHFMGRAVVKVCSNGVSELMTTISSSLVNMLYNYQLMKLQGPDGVAAYGVIMYVNFVFVGIYVGYSFGVAPVVSYHYGAEDTDELKNLLKRSLRMIAMAAVILTGAAELLAGSLAGIFVGYDESLYRLTIHGFRIYCLAFLIMGFNGFTSSFFTALNNGAVSALISFGRTLVFQCISVLLLPRIFGINGVWMSIIVAELLALILSSGCLLKYRNRYHYM